MTARIASLVTFLVVGYSLAALSVPTGDKEATICHFPPGNPDNFQTQTIGSSSLPAHLAHGDLVGSCPQPCGRPVDGQCAGSCLNPNAECVPVTGGRCACIAPPPPPCGDRPICAGTCESRLFGLGECVNDNGCVCCPLSQVCQLFSNSTQRECCFDNETCVTGVGCVRR